MGTENKAAVERATTLAIAWQQNRDNGTLAKLMMACRGLVYFFARFWAWKVHCEADELAQEGYLGVWEAAEKFDAGNYSEFTRYAGWWIRQRISRYALRYVAPVDIGKNTKAAKVFLGSFSAGQWADKIRAQDSRAKDETRSELTAKLMEMTEEEKRLMETVISSQCHLKLDAPSMKGSDKPPTTNGDRFPTPNLECPEITLGRDREVATVFGYLALLGERDREILLLRFYHPGEFTLDEVGQRYTLTRERIRQLQDRALLKVQCLISTGVEPDMRAGEMIRSAFMVGVREWRPPIIIPDPPSLNCQRIVKVLAEITDNGEDRRWVTADEYRTAATGNRHFLGWSNKQLGAVLGEAVNLELLERTGNRRNYKYRLPLESEEDEE